MANKNVKVSVSGINPVASGSNWFAIDETGTFQIDHDIVATIWLVGGGCDGEKGDWNGKTFVALGGSGGDGGYVYTTSNVSISKNTDCVTVIAEANDKAGTTLTINDTKYRCNQSGYTKTIGGGGSSITGSATGSTYSNLIEPTSGQTGVSTPYQVIGSSGGGAMACDGHDHRTDQGSGGVGAGKGGGHRQEGNNAINHGCGGGGGDGCGAVAIGHDGGSGMKGCIVVSYTVIDPPTLVVQKHYKRVCNTHRSCDTDYYSNSSKTSCCGGGCGCGCGGNKSAYASDYTDTIHIGSSGVK